MPPGGEPQDPPHPSPHPFFSYYNQHHHQQHVLILTAGGGPLGFYVAPRSPQSDPQTHEPGLGLTCCTSPRGRRRIALSGLRLVVRTFCGEHQCFLEKIPPALINQTKGNISFGEKTKNFGGKVLRV